MTLKQFASDIFGYRIKEGETGWDEAAQMLSKTGTWSITASPRKFEKLVLEMCKRIEALEEKTIFAPTVTSYSVEAPDDKPKNDTPVQPSQD